MIINQQLTRQGKCSYARMACVLLLLLFCSSLQAQRAIKVIDGLSREPLSFATLSDAASKYSSYADENGRAVVPDRTTTLMVSYVGYAAKEVSLPVEMDQVLIVELEIASFLPVIEVRNSNATPDFKPSVHIVRMAELRTTPMLLGEFDPLKALSALPGVSNGAEGTAGIIIWGGNANQTAILIDGQQVYNVNHVGGFLSAIPDYGVQAVRLYKGGVPVRYGGRLSGVVDLVLKNGRNDRVSFQAGIGTALLRGGAEGPITKKITYLVSGRLGYPTLINDLASAGQYEKGISGSHTTVRVYDGIGKITFTDKDWTVSLNTFLAGDSGFDQFTGSSQLFLQDFKWSNSLVGLKVNRQVSAALLLEGGVGLSTYRYAYDEFDRRFSLDSTLKLSSAAGDLAIQDRRVFLRSEYTMNANLSLEAGVEYIGKSLDQTFQAARQGRNLRRTDISQRNSEASVFTSGNWTHPQGAGQITAGLRATRYETSGFALTRLEPRINASLRLLPKVFLHAGYDVQSQFAHELITSVNILPNSVWIVADELTPPARSSQTSVGLAGEIGQKARVNWSLEVFTKSLDGLVRIQTGFERDVQAGLADNRSAIATAGTGTARGVEMSLKGDLGKLSYQLAYTLMRSERIFPTVITAKNSPSPSTAATIYPPC
jgi:outer membrane cobalamin receptor